ncbi:MAG: GTP-binding protein [Thermodesulfovibrionales bacterium]
MKTTIVCGMLGSGKTTFIRNQLDGAREKTVVLVNDFGQTGIDGEIFSANGIESIELPSGCVCCTLKFDLMTTLGKIRDQFDPDHLVVEPSGIASPSGVTDALDSLGISPYTVIGVIDSVEFLELYESEMFGSFFLDQVLVSDILLANKSDLAGPAITERTVRVLEGINPSALIYRTVDAVMRDPLPERPHTRPATALSGKHLRFDTASFRLSGPLPLASLRDLFSAMAEGGYGRIVRAKALVMTDQGPHRLDLASGNAAASAFPREIPAGRLVVIGLDLKKDELGAALKAFPLS